MNWSVELSAAAEKDLKRLSRDRLASLMRAIDHWYWGPPPQVYKNLIVIEWGFDDVQESCTSYEKFDRYNRFAMGEENSPIYLCRGVKFDIQKIWWHSHHWN